MNDSKDYKKEYDAFLKKVPYQTVTIDGVYFELKIIVWVTALAFLDIIC